MKEVVAFLVVIAGAAVFLVFTTPGQKRAVCARLRYGLRPLRLLSADNIGGALLGLRTSKHYSLVLIIAARRYSFETAIGRFF